MTHTNRTRRLPRAAFTLIELLVVIGIIALLVSLSTAAYQRVRVSQQVRTTEDVVAKVQMGLDNQVKIIADKVRGEALLATRSQDFTDLKPFCDNDDDRTAAVLMYCRLRQYLPQTAGELGTTMTAAPLAGQPGFTVGAVNFPRPLAFKSLAGISGAADPVSAAALFAALTGQTQGGNNFAADEALSGAQIDVTLGGVTARVFKDGWGNPIGFVRFYQSADLPGASTSGGRDPFDPSGKIYGWTGGNSGLGRRVIKGTVGVDLAVGSSSFPSYNFGLNTTATAYSFGLDKLPGTGDDIMGYRLRSIGAKGGPKQ